MAVIPYWRERLKARKPLGLEALWLVGYNVKLRDDNPEDTWPKAVAKQALLLDYKAWFEETYLPPYLESAFFRDFPEQLPKPASDLDFFVTMSPFLHVVGRAQQTRAYNVPQKKMWEGKWVSVKVHRNFVRLCTWQEHVAAFELQTHTSLDVAQLPVSAQADLIDTVAKGVQVSIRQIAANKDAMAIGKAGKT